MLAKSLFMYTIIKGVLCYFRPCKSPTKVDTIDVYYTMGIHIQYNVCMQSTCMRVCIASVILCMLFQAMQFPTKKLIACTPR